MINFCILYLLYTHIDFVSDDKETILQAYKFIRDENYSTSELIKGCIVDIDPFLVNIELKNERNLNVIHPWKTSGWILATDHNQKCTQNAFIPNSQLETNT